MKEYFRRKKQMRYALTTIAICFAASMALASYGYIEVDPNPASIPEDYTVYLVFTNTTGQDIYVYSVEDSGSSIECNVSVSAGNSEVVYSASGVTYTPGEFYHKPVFYTSDGTYEGDSYVFVVR
jgi:hypothetical protein